MTDVPYQPARTAYHLAGHSGAQSASERFRSGNGNGNGKRLLLPPFPQVARAGSSRGALKGRGVVRRTAPSEMGGTWNV
jgi:hypothetical protein